MEQPLVSIVIITMNHEKFIEQACRSAISQTYDNFEIVFLDNCSDDNTYEKGKKILEDSGISCTFIKNTEKFKVSKNLNILVSKASGDYISILSGDDWWAENIIEEKVNYIKNHPSDFVLSDGYKYIQETGETIEAYQNTDKTKVIKSLNSFFHENVVQNKTINVGTFVKKELLDQYPFDENLHTEDWDMNLQLSSRGYKIGFIDKKLFYYRILSTSLSRNWTLMSDSYNKVTSKYLDYINADQKLRTKYLLTLLQFKYEIMLSEAISEEEKKEFQKRWTREKYELKYKNPVLFFKLLFLK
ncbi:MULTISPECIES: glycosyltransferase [Chryseobacterium]|uniref:Glycosyltransferase EpsE n=1 Tax=Chryseobacterium salivictor TaxID=2547600 RepID=A0A4P6ZF97_9FLAO|nr:MULTISPECIES: glycosyltransferase [Chryseobacterium]MDQ0477900.1 glycosyltransferase involved in cell wall biosynthesis [Chryseobacterium sp. MDT2-18]QBO58185.1 Putative glycosyltransferase EpsE [Chryseobacterium salivictor]